MALTKVIRRLVRHVILLALLVAVHLALIVLHVLPRGNFIQILICLILVKYV